MGRGWLGALGQKRGHSWESSISNGFPPMACRLTKPNRRGQGGGPGAHRLLLWPFHSHQIHTARLRSSDIAREPSGHLRGRLRCTLNCTKRQLCSLHSKLLSAQSAYGLMDMVDLELGRVTESVASGPQATAYPLPDRGTNPSGPNQ